MPNYALEIIDLEVAEQRHSTRIWFVNNRQELIKQIIKVALGHAEHLVDIIRGLDENEDIPSHQQCIDDLVNQLSLKGKKDPITYHRDGFLFEIISWIAAVQTYSNDCLFKTPHLRSTEQGQDGIILDVDRDQKIVRRVVICEDKCSERPKKIFNDKVIPLFQEYCKNKRLSELISISTTLLKQIPSSGRDATRMANDLFNAPDRRNYRASLVIPSLMENISAESTKVFEKYSSIGNVCKSQIHGEIFQIEDSTEIRTWFDDLANEIINHLINGNEERVDV